MATKILAALIYTAAGLLLLSGGTLGALVAALVGIEALIEAHSPDTLASFQLVVRNTIGDWERLKVLGVIGGSLFTLAIAYDFGRSVIGGTGK